MAMNRQEYKKWYDEQPIGIEVSKRDLVPEIVIVLDGKRPEALLRYLEKDDSGYSYTYCQPGSIASKALPPRLVRAARKLNQLFEIFGVLFEDETDWNTELEEIVYGDEQED